MQNPSKRLVLLTIIVVSGLLAVGLAFGEQKRYTVPLDDAVFLGPDDAPITIIEFLDFQ